MPEVLGEADVYFDPEHTAQIAQALQKLLGDHRRRQECAQGAYERAQQYSWERCAKETFSFLSHIAQSYCE
jgi:glycosyltransferase involved in cell wall biosynthesis